MTHFMDAVEDAVNAAVGHQPRGAAELHGAVGAFEEVMKGLAYIMVSLEYGYRGLPDGPEELIFETYAGESPRSASEAKARVLELLSQVHQQLAESTLPQLEQVAAVTARLAEPRDRRR